MGAFTEIELPENELGLTESPYPVLCQVDSDLWVSFFDYSFTRKNGEVHTVSKGKVTDLASIPRIAWDILPPFGKYTGPALVHDDLYEKQTCSREEADLILLEAMEAAGVDELTRELIYHAVRIGGQEAWDAHAARKKGA